MVSAWVVFNYFPDLVRSMGTSNYGTLMKPVKLPVTGLIDVNGKSLPADIFEKKWTYVYFNTGECDRTCFDHLMIIKNVRLSQGKEVSRMKRLFVIASGKVNDGMRDTLAKFPSMRTVLLNSDEQRALMQKTFATEDKQDPFTSNAIYIVDPDSKVMMHYKEEKVKVKKLEGMEKDSILGLAKGMQGDMAKLMKNSQLRK